MKIFFNFFAKILCFIERESRKSRVENGRQKTGQLVPVPDQSTINNQVDWTLMGSEMPKSKTHIKEVYENKCL